MEVYSLQHVQYQAINGCRLSLRILASYDSNSDMVPFQLRNNALTSRFAKSVSASKLKDKVHQSSLHMAVPSLQKVTFLPNFRAITS